MISFGDSYHKVLNNETKGSPKKEESDLLCIDQVAATINCDLADSLKNIDKNIYFKVKKPMEIDSDEDASQSSDGDMTLLNIKEELKKSIQEKQNLYSKNYSDISDEENSLIDDQYECVRIKCYSLVTVKEEPFENLRKIFKESHLPFERQKYHQSIFETIISNFKDITSINDLQTAYLNHLHEAGAVEIFACSLCKYETMNSLTLRCHLLAIHNEKMENDIFRCRLCHFEANCRNTIGQHIISKHKPIKKPPKKKEKPKKSIKKNKTLKEPKTSDSERWPCQLCHYVARSDEKLKKHVATHKDRSNCDLCSFQSKNKAELQNHKDTHKNGKSFLCYMCSYTITNKATLGRHLVNVHKIENEASKRSKMCEYCSFSCSSKNQLEIHYLTHKTVNDLKEEEIFKCPEPGCNHQTKLKCHLRVHMKRHRAPDFVCEICGFATRRKESYRNHLITHKRISEIEWLKCTICPYQARNTKLLRRHMRNGDHSGKSLRHIRNRDRKREVEENNGHLIETGQNIVDDLDKTMKVKKSRKRRKKKDIELQQISEPQEETNIILSLVG